MGVVRVCSSESIDIVGRREVRQRGCVYVFYQGKGGMRGAGSCVEWGGVRGRGGVLLVISRAERGQRGRSS